MTSKSASEGKSEAGGKKSAELRGSYSLGVIDISMRWRILQGHLDRRSARSKREE